MIAAIDARLHTSQRWHDMAAVAQRNHPSLLNWQVK